ncbi:MAG: M1 family metallopeptidase [Bacteroidota bacterium]
MSEHDHSISKMSRTVICVGMFLFLPVSSLFPQSPFVSHANDPNTEPREHAVDVKHMRIEVSFAPEKGLVKGRVTHFFAPLRSKVDSIFFDGPGIVIKEAILNGKPVRFGTSPAGVTVYPSSPLAWGRTDSLLFVYEATPRKGLYFVGWNDPKNLSRKQIWTQGQGIDNRHWVPCYDETNDKLTTETIVTVQKELNVLSNGVKLSEKDNGNGTKTWHYAMTHPHTSYLVMLGIGDYAVDTRKSRSGVPVHLWYYPDQPERVEPTYRYSAEMIDFIEEQTGVRYPWESYSQIPVQDFMYGAMENTMATVFGDFFLVDARAFHDRNYIDVNVHELTHQWFGDYVTARSSKHSWLQESFATFYPKLFRRAYFGQDEYEWMRRQEHTAALTASQADRYPIVHSRAGGARIYQKGSAVLEMMMYTFGEAEFRGVIQYYLQKHPYANVETVDFYHAFQDTLGIVPDWFFDQWLYRGGEPQYEVSYSDVQLKGTSGRQTEILVRQTHATDELVKLFKMPVVFEAHYTDGTFGTTRSWVQRETEKIIIPNPTGKAIAFVLFDPGSVILKKVVFQKSFQELRAQAFSAPLMIDRYDAVLGMRSIGLDVKRGALVQVYDKNPFHAIQAEIVAQLANDPHAVSRNLLKRSLLSESAPVRLSALSNIQHIVPELREHFEQLLRDSSYAVIVMALEKLSMEYPQHVTRYADLSKDLQGVGNEVKVKSLELKGRGGDEASIKALVGLTGPSYEFRTRANALEALKRLNYLGPDLLPHLFDALTHFNNRLRAPATSIAAFFLQQTAYADQMRKYYHARVWQGWQQEMLDRVIR